MKSLLLLISFLLMFLISFSQKLSRITFSLGTTLSSFSFITDQQVIIKISEDGKVIEWGIDMDPRRYNYYPGKLEPFMARVDYYGPEADSISRGKVKSIGTCFLTYYGAYEMESKIGKVKSIGNLILDYYTKYEATAPAGKLKSISTILLSYYSAYENEAFRGKLKSVANNQITYYSTFDEPAIKGKVKSIGGVSYVWYSSIDSRGYPGTLKSGRMQENIGGITYLISYLSGVH